MRVLGGQVNADRLPPRASLRKEGHESGTAAPALLTSLVLLFLKRDIGIMEKNMETTIVNWGYVGFQLHIEQNTGESHGKENGNEMETGIT